MKTSSYRTALLFYVLLFCLMTFLYWGMGEVAALHRQSSDLRLLLRHVPSKLLDQGDLLEFEVALEPLSVLILRQKYHRDWQAAGLRSIRLGTRQNRCGQ